jgi:hypothetical protein
MNPEIKTKWIETLRSGKYKQGKGRLRTKDDHYCCLGVLCEVMGMEWFPLDDGWAWAVREKNTGYAMIHSISGNTQEQVGLDPYQTSTLMRMNDTGDSFEVIAEYIEEKM